MTEPPTPDFESPPLRTTLIATAIALGIAAVVLVTAVLPAEYGVDPTGIGELLGFTDLAPSDDNDTAAATQEPSNATTLFTYRAVWTTTPIEPQERAGYTSEGSATDTTIDLTQPGMTELTFTLSWDDTNETVGQSTGPDTFRINVTAPDGTQHDAVLGRNDPDTTGTARIRIPLTPTPDPLLVEGTTPDEAIDRARTTHAPSRTGIGAWTVHIECVEAQDASGVPQTGLPGAGGATGDQGNDWTLTVSGTRSELDEAALEQVDIRRETTTFTVAPGEGLEYKLKLQEGDQIEYEWHEPAGLKLLFDFHGEPEGEPGFTSHRTGTKDADQGTLKAPFTGNHGWYFENRNQEPATITLTVRGVFETVGIV